MNMNTINEALNYLKKGKLIIVTDDDNREAEGDLIGLANLVTAENINFMTKYARGLICAPITQQRAVQLGLSPMSTKNTDAFGTAFTVSVDHKETTTGISAFDRAKTIFKLSQTTGTPDDFFRPGHIFPLIGEEGGLLQRRGHTEAALELAQLANKSEAAYICEILNDDGTMARRPKLEELAALWQLPIISIEELTLYLRNQHMLTVNLPSEYGDFKLSLFTDEEGRDNLLIAKGQITPDTPPLIRIHSECLTGDIFGSHRCDCGEQLHESLRMINQNGNGALIYLRQEGRGIGLKNKLLAYQLQEHGRDTVEANLELGFQADERHYSFATEILKTLGITRIRLITNNPDKIAQIQAEGIQVVERVPLEISPHPENISYLRTKQAKFHHFLSI